MNERMYVVPTFRYLYLSAVFKIQTYLSGSGCWHFAESGSGPDPGLTESGSNTDPDAHPGFFMTKILHLTKYFDFLLKPQREYRLQIPALMRALQVQENSLFWSPAWIRIRSDPNKSKSVLGSKHMLAVLRKNPQNIVLT
jgi:hypothetical protein